MPPKRHVDAEPDNESEHSDASTSFSLASDDLAQFALDDTDDDPDYESEDSDAAIDPRLLDDTFPSFSDDEDEDDPDISLAADAAMASFHNDLKAAGGFKKARTGRQLHGNRFGGRRAVGEQQFSFEVNSLMGDANQNYAMGNLDAAMAAVKKVIQIEAGVYAAWKLMGEIFRERGDERRCLLAFLSAAHARPKDWELWLECAKMSLGIAEEAGVEAESQVSAEGERDKQSEEWLAGGKGGWKEQAIYCYTRAISANPENIDAIFDRALLYKETGKLKKAAEGLMMIHNLLPYDMGMLKEIASLYTQMGHAKIAEAIGLYEKAIAHFRKKKDKRSFGWSELNILVELFIMDKRWIEAINTIKEVARWLLGRDEETFWDNYEDDREWDVDDASRESVAGFDADKFSATAYMLPIELRVKLGLCRLELTQTDAAMKHFSYLTPLDPIDYYDLFAEVGHALFQHSLFESAIHYYFNAVQGSPEFDRKLWFNLAHCYKALDQVDDAEECYNGILENNPTDTYALLELANIYEMSDRRGEALDLVNKVLEIRSHADWDDDIAETGRRRYTTRFGPDGARVSRLTVQEAFELNERRTEQTSAKYKKLEMIWPEVQKGKKEAVKEWLDVAGDLVDDFRNTRALYPSERGKPFMGFISTAARRAKAVGEQVRIQKMQIRLQETLGYEELPAELPDAGANFRGLPFPTWLSLFLTYALTLAIHSDYRDSYSVCAAAKECTVFYRSKPILTTIWATWLSCAILARDHDSVSTILRWFLTTFQFQTEVYNMFTIALTATGERGALDVYHSAANQKYMLRHIKIMDESISGKKRINAAQLTNLGDNGKELVPQEMDTLLLMLYGHMLHVGKSYRSALNYYTRAYALSPESPVINLCIALSYMHRSMQRQSENRHFQALQCWVFFLEYAAKRRRMARELMDIKEGEEDLETEIEIQYNLARAEHHYGLSHLAVRRYEKVLQIGDEKFGPVEQNHGTDGKTTTEDVDDDGDVIMGDADSAENTVAVEEVKHGDTFGDMRYEAAYNLQMIYMTSGCEELAMEVTKKWLII
ncbi:TPR-like protein [Ascodesmis nigricans]|uniref:TPR-like protein n=1 Tax=Ascodesmis nigricans TaxID=341454 RepID=A0A4S2N2G0_9PEZI|nr:TPR-like protein [Ascodesmis nigricans]